MLMYGTMSIDPADLKTKRLQPDRKCTTCITCFLPPRHVSEYLTGRYLLSRMIEWLHSQVQHTDSTKLDKHLRGVLIDDVPSGICF